MEINRDILTNINMTNSLTLEQKNEMLKIFNGSKGVLKDFILLFYINNGQFAQCSCGEKGLVDKNDYDYKCPKCGCDEIIEVYCDNSEGSDLLGFCYEDVSEEESEIKVKITPYGLFNRSLSSYDFDLSDDFYTVKYDIESKEITITDSYNELVVNKYQLSISGFYSPECSYVSNNQLFEIFKELIPKHRVNDEFTLRNIMVDFLLQLKAPIYRDNRVENTCLKRFNGYYELETLDEIDDYLNKLRKDNIIDIDKDNIEEAFKSDNVDFICNVKNLDDLKELREFDELVLKNELELYLEYFIEVKEVEITTSNKQDIIKLCEETQVDFKTIIKHIFRGINNEDLKLSYIISNIKTELKYIEEYPIDFSKPYSSKRKKKREFNRNCPIDDSILERIYKKPTLDTLYKALIG